jgi:signal transduction histidine kinase/ActR/RegA family two-component response regulator
MKVRYRASSRRHLALQLGSVSLVALVAAPLVGSWLIALWAAAVLGASLVEERLWRAYQLGAAASGRARLGAPALRVLGSILFAGAAAVLIVRGDAGPRTFAVALIACSMVYVLLRYHRSLVLFATCISPHMLVLGWVGLRMTLASLARGEVLAALAPAATLVLFGALFWAARGQLVDSFEALSKASARAQEQARAARSADRAKSKFLATMSHELRTPLNGVLGMAQAMSAEPLSRVQRQRLKVIRRSAESLMAILNDLLDLSRIETNRFELEIDNFDLEHMARGVVMAFSHAADSKGLAVEFEIEPAARGYYRGDAARLRRILYALMSNAVKFTDHGKVSLRAHADGDGVVFSVADTGIGIAPEQRTQLFERFHQADSSSTRRFGGAGLGLAVCHELVALMGGTIVVASVPEAGSVFTVHIPLARAPAAPQPAPAPLCDAGELRVLAAEDNEANQLVLKTLLKQLGVEVTIVGNGREALEHWELQTWDLMLMDIQMPEMDGVSATRAIRRRESQLGRPRTPIVAVTANAMRHQLADYEAAGIDSVVPKPIEAARLYATLEAVLAKIAEGPAAVPRQAQH